MSATKKSPNADVLLVNVLLQAASLSSALCAAGLADVLF